MQQNEIKRGMNKARSICMISPQSSLYAPIIDPPRQLPSFLHVDLQSEWYTSALICSAVETVTLPSRLCRYHDFEASLAGDDGTHKIFELQSTIIGKEGTRAEKLSASGKGLDPQALECGSEGNVETEFDLDFTYDDLASKNQHIFNQIQVVRGGGFDNAGESEAIDDIGLLRRKRFYDSEPMLQRFVIQV